MWHRQYAPILGLIIVVFGISTYANSVILFKDNPRNLRYFPPFREGVSANANLHLGGEYHQIARSIVAGEGFSDPFRQKTGPTAWMPPVYPFLLSLLFKVFGTSLRSRFPIAICILLIKNSVLVGTGVLCYEMAKRARSAIPAGWVFLSYGMFLSCYFFWAFQFTHDCWMLLLVMDMILALALRMQSKANHSRGSVAAWGLLGGFAALSSPVLGLTWFAAGAHGAASRRQVRPFLLALVMAAALVLPWTVRNYVVFHKFVPVKSNLFYDLYNTSYESEDGLFDHVFALRHLACSGDPDGSSHPFGGRSEQAFMDDYKKKFIEALRSRPRKFLQAVSNRALAALVVYHPYNEFEGFLLGKRVIHFLPLIGLLLVTFSGARRRSHVVTLVAVTYVTYLAPYVLVTYYDRYGVALLAGKALLVFWCADAVVAGIARSRQAQREQQGDVASEPTQERRTCAP